MGGCLFGQHCLGNEDYNLTQQLLMCTFSYFHMKIMASAKISVFLRVMTPSIIIPLPEITFHIS